LELFVNNYLLGNQPPSFDILYLNADQPYCHHPVCMATTWISISRTLSSRRKLPFVTATSIDMSRTRVDIQRVAVMTDHITPWKGVPKTAPIWSRGHLVLSSSVPSPKPHQPATNPQPPSFRIRQSSRRTLPGHARRRKGILWLDLRDWLARPPSANKIGGGLRRWKLNAIQCLSVAPGLTSLPNNPAGGTGRDAGIEPPTRGRSTIAVSCSRFRIMHVSGSGPPLLLFTGIVATGIGEASLESALPARRAIIFDVARSRLTQAAASVSPLDRWRGRRRLVAESLLREIDVVRRVLGRWKSRSSVSRTISTSVSAAGARPRPRPVSRCCRQAPLCCGTGDARRYTDKKRATEQGCCGYLRRSLSRRPILMAACGRR